MARITKKTKSEKELWMQESQRDIDMLAEIAGHTKVLSDQGIWCQVMFDNVRNLAGAKPTCGVVVARLSDIPGKSETLMNIRPPASIDEVLKGLRTLVGVSNKETKSS